ncbi:kininogen-1-like [Leptodactylus fuscus]
MRLLPILLLCSYCLLGSATLIDVECNDQNVFRAVDEALRSFNNEKEDGNQFILYRITDAKIKNEEGGQINHFVQYETYEGSCKVKNGKSWQECSSTYKNPAKCSAHVLFNKDQSFNSVEYQQCTNSNDIELNPVTAVHQPCLGCPQPIDKENKELLCFVHSAIEQVNADANHSLYFDLESIVNATRQVTNGWQYHIQFLIRQTNCSKSSFTSKHSMECILDQGGESIVCNARVHVTSKGEVGEPFVECKSGTVLAQNYC